MRSVELSANCSQSKKEDRTVAVFKSMMAKNFLKLMLRHEGTISVSLMNLQQYTCHVIVLQARVREKNCQNKQGEGGGW